MIDDINELFDDLINILSKYIWSYRGLYKRDMTAAEKQLFYSIFKLDKRQKPGSPSRNFPGIIMSLMRDDAITKQLKQFKQVQEKMSINVVGTIESLISDGWDRVLEGAKYDMFDALQMDQDDDVEWRGNTYSDPDDIDQQDMFDFFNEREGRGFFIDWFRQEVAHNIETNDIFKKYVGDANTISWDNILQKGYPDHDIDYLVQQETSEKVQNQIDHIGDYMIQVFARIRKELQLSENRQLIMNVIFGDKSYIRQVDWTEVT